MTRRLLVLPAAAWYLLFFVVPLAFPLYYVFTSSIGAGGPDVSGFPTLDSLTRLNDSIYISALIRTFALALAGTVVLLILGFPVAYFLSTLSGSNRFKYAVIALIIVPSWASSLIRTYSWIILLSGHGPAIVVLRALNIIDANTDLLYTPVSVWIGIVYNYLPLMILSLWAGLERLDKSLVEASTDLGANPIYTFRKITFRLALPSIVAATVLVFIPLSGEYIIPQLLGGGKVDFVGNVIVRQFQDARDWAFGSALGMALIVIAILIVGVYVLLTRNALRKASA